MKITKEKNFENDDIIVYVRKAVQHYDYDEGEDDLAPYKLQIASFDNETDEEIGKITMSYVDESVRDAEYDKTDLERIRHTFNWLLDE